MRNGEEQPLAADSITNNTASEKLKGPAAAGWHTAGPCLCLFDPTQNQDDKL